MLILFPTVYIKRKIYHKELAHMIIEVNKSPNLQSSAWRPRNAHGVVPIWKPRGLRLRKYQCFSSLSSFKAVRLEEFPLTGRKVTLFVLFEPSTDWVCSTQLRKAICFPQPTNSNVNLIQKHLLRFTQNNVKGIRDCPAAQPNWPIELTITRSLT